MYFGDGGGDGKCASGLVFIFCVSLCVFCLRSGIRRGGGEVVYYLCSARVRGKRGESVYRLEDEEKRFEISARRGLGREWEEGRGSGEVVK